MDESTPVGRRADAAPAENDAPASKGPPVDAPAQTQSPKPPERPSRLVPVVLGAAVLAVLLTGGFLIWHAESKTNKVALTSAPRPVTVVKAKARPFQPSRTYVGTLQPWMSANVGPQLVSAYVDTVLVRPGAIVNRGDVLATLDCRDANAASKTVAAEALAVDAKHRALANESTRVQSLLEGHFVSPNEAEQKQAASSAEAATLQAMRAQLGRNALSVNDCVLKAPFDGEIATRTIDPGAFVHPGVSIVSIVDRNIVLFEADVPEIDFDVVAPSIKVAIDADSITKTFNGRIARRAPSTDAATRTIHFECDVPDPKREIPVGTTASAHIDVGTPVAATEIPLAAAQVSGKKAVIYVVTDDVAHVRTVLVIGETAGSLFVETALEAGSLVVLEGRSLLSEGDRVSASEVSAGASVASAAAPAVVPVKAVGTATSSSQKVPEQ